ncbi:putative DNA-binding transcriptional regulator AlpA [Granulicella aggregans]|uniref:Putative DNA-binding transcriptional regulator AlpA n=1 Tax=Granulicella aggregans TaxID=474949 RepID=A0A7W7ZCP2_9BACT|nr:putative DNA-binding transcriptional regulator AlpA [Granulicella aggregans]
MVSNPLTYTVDEFCHAMNISRSGFYALRKRGEGPREARVGGRNLISRDAAVEWLRGCERNAIKVPETAN